MALWAFSDKRDPNPLISNLWSGDQKPFDFSRNRNPSSNNSWFCCPMNVKCSISGEKWSNKHRCREDVGCNLRDEKTLNWWRGSISGMESRLGAYKKLWEASQVVTTIGAFFMFLLFSSLSHRETRAWNMLIFRVTRVEILWLRRWKIERR